MPSVANIGVARIFVAGSTLLFPQMVTTFLVIFLINHPKSPPIKI